MHATYSVCNRVGREFAVRRYEQHEMHDDRMSTTPHPLHVERSGDVLSVTLSRPRRANALDRTLVECFHAVLDDPVLVTDLRALVVAGAERNFCAGFDLSDLESQSEDTLIVRFLRIEALLQRLYHAPYLTIACAHGNAIGAGADIFVACDRRIAEPDTRFRMPGWQFGIALGTRRLVDRIGNTMARDILSESRTLVGSQALECGLATAVAIRAEWPALVTAAVDESRALPLPALAHLRSLSINDHRDADMSALAASALGPTNLKERLISYALAVRSGPAA